MMATKSTILAISCVALISLQLPAICDGLSLKENNPSSSTSRRQAVGSILGGGAAVFASALFPAANVNAMDTTDVDDFLRTGGVAMPMGVSGQAGKSKPDTGVLIREGTEISRDSKSGNVLAEVLVKQKGNNGDLMAVVTSFQSPWSLGKFQRFKEMSRTKNHRRKRFKEGKTRDGFCLGAGDLSNVPTEACKHPFGPIQLSGCNDSDQSRIMDISRIYRLGVSRKKNSIE